MEPTHEARRTREAVGGRRGRGGSGVAGRLQGQRLRPGPGHPLRLDTSKQSKCGHDYLAAALEAKITYT